MICAYSRDTSIHIQIAPIAGVSVHHDILVSGKVKQQLQNSSILLKSVDLKYDTKILFPWATHSSIHIQSNWTIVV